MKLRIFLNTLALESIASATNQLSLLEQVRPLERLAQRVRTQTERQQNQDNKLAVMAADPAIQRELRQIEAEFSETEMGRLPNEAPTAKES